MPDGKIEKAEMDARVIRTESQRRQMIRERMGSTGGPRLKLAVFGTIPGYQLFWENDEDNAIEQRLFEGFEFVEPREVKMQSWVVSDSDVAGKVSKWVGKKADGNSLRGYLLKLPVELWDEHQARSHKQADEWDEAIRKGAVGNVDSRYKPKHAEIDLNTKQI